MKFDFDDFMRLAVAFTPLLTATAASVPGGQKVAPLVPAIIGAMIAVEQLTDSDDQPIPGAQKKALVQQIVSATVQVTNATSKVQIDPVAAHDVADNGIDAVIGAINETQRAVAAAKAKPKG